MSQSVMHNFELLTSKLELGYVDESEWWFQYVDFMEALEKVDINIKLALISLLPKDISIFLRCKLFDLLISEFKKSSNLKDKSFIIKFLMIFSSEFLYIFLWKEVRDECAVSGEWSLYDKMSKITLAQDRKLFNKCIGC